MFHSGDVDGDGDNLSRYAPNIPAQHGIESQQKKRMGWWKKRSNRNGRRTAVFFFQYSIYVHLQNYLNSKLLY